MVLQEGKIGAFDVTVELTSDPKACRLKGMRAPGDEGSVLSRRCKFMVQPSKQGEAVVSLALGSEQTCSLACSGKSSFVGTYGYEKSEPVHDVGNKSATNYLL